MAFESFRDFIRLLDREGELIRSYQPAATKLEITELADRQMKSPGGGKALLIEKPTINGEVASFPTRHQYHAFLETNGHEFGRRNRGRSRPGTGIARQG